MGWTPGALGALLEEEVEEQLKRKAEGYEQILKEIQVPAQILEQTLKVTKSILENRRFLGRQLGFWNN